MTVLRPSMQARCHRAFTLFEMIATALLVGIMAAIIIARVRGTDDASARANIVESSLAVLQAAVERYYFDNGQFPATIDDLVTAGYIPSAPKSLHAGKQFTLNGSRTVLYQ